MNFGNRDILIGTKFKKKIIKNKKKKDFLNREDQTQGIGMHIESNQCLFQIILSCTKAFSKTEFKIFIEKKKIIYYYYYYYILSVNSNYGTYIMGIDAIKYYICM